MKRLTPFALFLLLMPFWAVHAQTESATETQQEETPWYQIEIIIFEYANLNNTDTETWPRDPGAPDIDNTTKLIPTAAVEDYLNLISPEEEEQREEPTAISFPPPAPGENTETETPTDQPVIYVDETPFVILDKESVPHELSLATGDLERSRNYHVLHHLAWRQPVLPPGESVSVHIHSEMEDDILFLEKAHLRQQQNNIENNHLPSGDDIPAEQPSLTIDTLSDEPTTIALEQDASQFSATSLDDTPTTASAAEQIQNAQPRLPLNGLIRVSLSRYLHLQADLILSREITLPVQPSIFLNKNTTTSTETDEIIAVRESPKNNPLTESIISTELGTLNFTETSFYQPYRLLESRRMRSKEVHYLDHPAFGIIALITPYERPTVNAEEEPEETPIENIMIGVTPDSGNAN